MWSTKLDAPCYQQLPTLTNRVRVFFNLKPGSVACRPHDRGSNLICQSSQRERSQWPGEQTIESQNPQLQALSAVAMLPCLLGFSSGQVPCPRRFSRAGDGGRLKVAAGFAQGPLTRRRRRSDRNSSNPSLTEPTVLAQV